MIPNVWPLLSWKFWAGACFRVQLLECVEECARDHVCDCSRGHVRECFVSLFVNALVAAFVHAFVNASLPSPPFPATSSHACKALWIAKIM